MQRHARIESLAIAVALLFVLGLSVARVHRGPRTEYTLTFHESNEPETEAVVEMAVSGVDRDTLELIGVADRAALDLHDVSATDERGAPITVRRTDRTLRVSGDKKILQHRYSIVSRKAPVHVRYRARIGQRQGDDHVGYNGMCFGFAGPSAVVFPGRSVFLVPDVRNGPMRVRVSLRTPRGWDVVTPWRGRAPTFHPGVRAGDELEHLIASTVGVGRFRLTKEKRFGTWWIFATPAFVPPSIGDPAVAKLQTATNYITSVFRRGLGPRYLTFVLPKSARLDEVPGEGWATGQGQTFIPLTSNRTRDFAEFLVDAYLLHAPYRSTLTDPRDYWFPAGLRRFYATKALVSTGFLAESDLASALALRLAMAPGPDSGPLRLERDYDVPGRDVPGGLQAGAALLYDLDRAVRHASSGTRSLDDVVAEAFHGAHAISPWLALPNVARADWTKYRETYLVEARSIPLSTFPGLPRLASAPNPPPGKPVRRLRLILTGTTGSFLEVCGCKVNQSGGAARRETMLRRLRGDGLPSVYLDAGNALPPPGQFRPEDSLAVGETALALAILKDQGAAAIAVSTYELTWGDAFYRHIASSSHAPFVSSITDRTGTPLAPERRVVTAGGTRIALVSAFEPPLYLEAQGTYENHAGEFRVPDPLAALERTLREARGEGDLVGVIGRLSPAFARRVATKFPDVDFIVSNECYAAVTEMKADGKPRFLDIDPPGFAGHTLILYASRSQYGISTADLDLTANGKIAGATFAEHDLDRTVPDDPAVRRRLTAFYERVGRETGRDALVDAPFAHDSLRWNGGYLGVEGCRTCHEDEYAQWVRTPHAGAYKTLLEAHRNYQPRCVSCHVVAYGAPHGYQFGDPSAHLVNVQCEVCHGPGLGHSRDPDVVAMQSGAGESLCLSCHTPDHSETFVYEERLPHVMHRATETIARGQMRASAP